MSHRERWHKKKKIGREKEEKKSFKRKDDDVGEEGCRVCVEE